MSVGEAPTPVAFILVARSGGGAAVAIERLIRLIDGTSAHVHGLGNDHPWLWRSKLDDTRRYILPDATPDSLGSSFSALRGARALIRTIRAIRRYSREHPTLVLLPFLTGTALVTLAATLGLPNPVIVCERNDPSRQRHGWHIELLKRLLYPKATAITVNAPGVAARDHLFRVSQGRPVYFVPNPRPGLMPQANVRSSRVILSVGRLVPPKRQLTLIEAFAQVQARVPDWHLSIVGEGPLRESLARLIKQRGLEKRITLAGHVEDIERLYAAAGLFVLASEHEGTSNALLEASSAGLPSIISDAIAPPAAEQTFVRVPAGCVEALSAALMHLCHDPELRLSLGNSAREWVAETRDVDVAATWASIWGSAVSG